MLKKIAVLLSSFALFLATTNVSTACIFGFAEDVETPEFLLK